MRNKTKLRNMVTIIRRILVMLTLSVLLFVGTVNDNATYVVPTRNFYLLFDD